MIKDIPPTDAEQKAEISGRINSILTELDEHLSSFQDILSGQRTDEDTKQLVRNAYHQIPLNFTFLNKALSDLRDINGGSDISESTESKITNILDKMSHVMNSLKEIQETSQSLFYDTFVKLITADQNLFDLVQNLGFKNKENLLKKILEIAEIIGTRQQLKTLPKVSQENDEKPIISDTALKLERRNNPRTFGDDDSSPLDY